MMEFIGLGFGVFVVIVVIWLGVFKADENDEHIP